MLVSETVCNTGATLFAVDPSSLKSLGGTDGAVYTCRKGDRAYVMKFVPVPEDQIPIYEEKQAFICFLAGNGVPLAAPLPSVNDRLYERVTGDEGSYLVTLTQHVNGRHPVPRNPYDWNERLFVEWGRLTGRLHALARQYPLWEQPAQPGEPTTRLMGWQQEFQSFVDGCGEPKVLKKLLPLQAGFGALPRDRSNYGLIHNDLHPRNFLYHPEGRDGPPLTIIDFDVCAYHWFINDIACALYHAIIQGSHLKLAGRQAYARSFLAAFLKGYRRENDLEDFWLEQMPFFLQYREILLYITLSHDWPEGKRARWQIAFLSEKRGRILRGEPVI